MSRMEIWVVPFFGQGHLFPCVELCKHIASRDFESTFIISSNLSTSIPSSFRQHPHIQVIEIPSSLPSPPPPQPQPASASDPMHHHFKHHEQMALALQNLLSTRPGPKPVCAILDVMMGWSTEVFAKFHIPTVGFFTSGACSAAIECATWKSHKELDTIKPGETRLLPGLPEDMAISYSDLKRRPHGPPGGPPPGPPPPLSGGPRPFIGGPKKMGPPKPGSQPMWVEEVEGVITLLINTCDDLESPFIRYISDQVGKPVWGVGPLLPEQYWKSAAAGSLLHDRELRTNNRKSNVTEDEVIQWLDSKPRGSVLYVSFGTEVGPTMEEYPRLADVLLESSSTTFIWVIQPGSRRSGPPRAFLGPEGQPGSEQEEEVGYFPHGLDSKVGNRGLIIRGWAPQLLILSHPSTAGFLSHCGWNSTVEAIGRGVPILAWPIRGDQYYDAKLVVNHLKVGYMISDDLSRTVQKEDIVKGIEKLMGDEDMKNRAQALCTKFVQGFPKSSVTALDAFRDFINHKAA
ncbi:scopoletin glucosyltransferase-like [Castanea sativa]|uniref:scopoletin glucosyltransferase-like n=1 Tax=Castanea sativa TaxID=21020 RepID=UPI003F64F78C